MGNVRNSVDERDRLAKALHRSWLAVMRAQVLALESDAYGLADDLQDVCALLHAEHENLMRRGSELRTRESRRAYLYPRLTDDRPPAA